jgi:hypothetical protein
LCISGDIRQRLWLISTQRFERRNFKRQRPRRPGDWRRRAEARDLLAPVYGWFTEGSDTPDLKEAKALPGQLT